MKKTEAISILATSVRPREAKDRARYDEAVRMAIEALKCSETPKSSERTSETAQPEKQHGRIFQEIVVRYPSYNPYPERKGKPYFLIKYTENGQEFIGYGTYKPEVLSEYLKEYFMPSAQPERKKGHWLRYGEDGYPNNEDTVFWQCDQCLEQYTGRTKRIPNFCPNCGADMRGGDENG